MLVTRPDDDGLANKSQRDAQFVLAREYGFQGWKDLLKEVKQRLGRGLEWAVSEAHPIIHGNDIEGLRQLLAEYPALLSWTGVAEAGVTEDLRNKTTGKFERITNPDKIEAAMNADEEYYRICTKDPNVHAFTDLMNRALDKPAQQTKVTGNG